MRVTTVLRLAVLSIVLAAPLASVAVAFASDDDSLTEARQQSTVSPYDPNQNLDPVFGISYPSTLPSDE